jgi:hypothetical protein
VLCAGRSEPLLLRKRSAAGRANQSRPKLKIPAASDVIAFATRKALQPQTTKAACGRNPMALLEGRAPSRPLAPGTRPRRSVALHITRKHARKTRMFRRKALSSRVAQNLWLQYLFIICWGVRINMIGRATGSSSAWQSIGGCHLAPGVVERWLPYEQIVSKEPAAWFCPRLIATCWSAA